MLTRVSGTNLDDGMIASWKSAGDLEILTIARYISVYSSKKSTTYTVRVNTLLSRSSYQLVITFKALLVLDASLAIRALAPPGGSVSKRSLCCPQVCQVTASSPSSKIVFGTPCPQGHLHVPGSAYSCPTARETYPEAHNQGVDWADFAPRCALTASQ